MPKYRLSLRRRAIFGIGFTYVVIIFAFAFSAFIQEQKIVKEEMMNTSMGCSRLFAKMVTEPLLKKDLTSIKMHMQQAGPMAKFSHGRNVRYVIIQDEEGRVVASSDDFNIEKFLRGKINENAFTTNAEIIQDAGSILDVAIPIFAEGVKQGVVRLGISTKDMQIKILKSRRWALQFMLGAIFIGALLGIVIDYQVKRNLQNLTATTRQIADGDFNQRVFINTGDELEEFGVAFNKMADKLQNAHVDLEHKVIERTQELRESQRQLVHNEKMASLGVLAAGLAHEIGNPLTAISSIVQILQRKSTETKHKEQLKLLSENINRISKIVRELSDFSRPVKTDRQPCQINELIRTALGILKYDPRAKKYKITTNLSKDLPRVNVVADQVLQVFINVILNAFDAMESQGELRISSSKRNHAVTITVTDTGKGIAPEWQEKIFEPFFTTKTVGQGSGLGLSVSYGIIKSLGGEIHVESEVGKGTTFVIVLP
ncbi:MAG: ATP-binding protein [bacterium]